MLVTSIFYFSTPFNTSLDFSATFILLSANAFVLDWSKIMPFGKQFNTFPNKPWFLRVCSTSLLKTLWEKEKLLVMSNFSFSCSVFYPFEELSTISLDLKLSSANSFSLEESKISRSVN